MCIRDRCGGDPFWTQQPNSYLSEKCVTGSTPCETLATSGFSSAGSQVRCNAQCYSVTTARADCIVPPAAAVDASAPPTLLGFAVENNLYAYAVLALWVICAVLFLSCCRSTFCPKDGSVRYVVVISVLLLALALALGGFGAYFYWWNGDLVESYVGEPTLTGAMVGAATLSLLTLLTLLGIHTRSSCALLLAFFLYAVLMLVQMCLTMIVCYWVHSLDD
eukprot:5251457-Prymnesium_polylepis.1